MKREISPAIYILSNKRNGTLYTGVTSNLTSRISEHKQNINCKFTTKYSVKMLVYFEWFETMEAAIAEEKRLKNGNRKQKLKLIESMNPQWKDLYETLF